jgi:hypothetical protein
MKRKPLPALLTLLSLLTGIISSCRTYPSGTTPIRIGTCQSGAQWPQENDAFTHAPGAYERYLWSPYLKSTRRQE